jgi:hypothetical protein
MTNVATPIQITAWYDKVPESPEAAEASPEAKKSTTPEYHNILIQNVTATGYNTKNSNDKNYNAIMIYGRPESYVYDVTFDHVNISHRNGIRMFFCKDIKFIDCSFTKTQTNQTVTATDTDLSPVMEKSYQVVYSWNVTSGINAVGTSSANDATCYSLQGYRLSEKPRRHSVYIQNKKKWIR